MPWRRMGEWSCSSVILYVSTRWRCGQLHTPAGWALPSPFFVFNFFHNKKNLPFYPCGRRHRYPLDRRMGEPQTRFGRCAEDKNLSPSGTRTPAVQLVAISTELSRFLSLIVRRIIDDELHALANLRPAEEPIACIWRERGYNEPNTVTVRAGFCLMFLLNILFGGKRKSFINPVGKDCLKPKGMKEWGWCETTGE
jgi:hypothetical protein